MPGKAAISMLATMVAAAACSSSPGASPDGAAGAGGDGAAEHGSDAIGAAPKLATSLVATIALPGAPIAAAYNAGTKKVYFACQTPAGASAGVAVVDDTTNTMVTKVMPSGLVTSLAANATTKKIYGVEADQVDVIDSAFDALVATVKIPDGGLIAGLAVDELHDAVYVVATLGGASTLYLLDGETNMMKALRGVLLTPTGAPPIAVDGATQKVFVLGVDSNDAGLVVMFDGISGQPQKLTPSDSQVSPTASGIIPLGDGTVDALLLAPNIIKRIGRGDVSLPGAFTPTGVAAGDLGRGPGAIVIGVGADGQPQGLDVDAATGAIEPFSLDLGAGVFVGTVAGQIVAAAPVAGGSEFYVDERPVGDAGAASPAETLKITVTAAP